MFQNLQYNFYSLKDIKNFDILKTFHCSIAPDIEDFLRNKAIEFEKRNVSKTQIKKIDGFSKFRECLGFYLIGQLGIDDNYRKLHKKQGLGNFLVDFAYEICKNSQNLVGGRFILIDAIKDKKVIEFYKNNHFYKLYEDDESIKMIMEL